MLTMHREPGRVLDFDLENRPLSYWYGDASTAEITAIGWCWIPPETWGAEDTVHTLLLRRDGLYEDMNGVAYPARKAFELFAAVLASADMVTGHYIRKHDLPLLNAAHMELGLPPLPEVMTQDTKLDLVRRKDLSTSQEALAAMVGLPEPKHHMTQAEWREANRLTPAGLESTRKRVVDDVIQHKALRRYLLDQRLLGAPRKWKP